MTTRLEPRAPLVQRVRLGAAKRSAAALGRIRPSRPRNPVFLVGCARSGTTLLERLLAMHPDVADWSEANEIWDPAWFPWREESSTRPPVESDPDAHTVGWEQSNLHRMDEIKSVFGSFQALTRRPIFLNKTPYHSFRIHHIVEHFPEAKLIYIRRDGRAVVNSYMTKLVAQGKLREWPSSQSELFIRDDAAFAAWIARYWERTCDEVEERDRQLDLTRSDTLRTFTYETLCADTAGVLNGACDFIGIDPARFDPAVWEQEVRDSNNKWNENLSTQAQHAIVEVAGPTLERYGYT